MKERPAVVVAVLLRHLDRDAQGAAARHDAHLAQRVGARGEVGDEGVTGLVVGDDLPLLGIHQTGAGRAKEDLVERLLEVGGSDLLAVAPGGGQRGLVDEISQIGAGEAGRAAGERAFVDVGG